MLEQFANGMLGIGIGCVVVTIALIVTEYRR